MAVLMPSTPHRATEPLPLAALFASPVLSRFERLTEALARYVAAERDLLDVDCWDPAFRPWLTASEAAHDGVMDALRDLRDADAFCAEDGLLQEMGAAILTCLGAETGMEARAGRLRVDQCLRSRSLARTGFGSRIPGLIAQAGQHLRALFLLDLRGASDDPEARRHGAFARLSRA